jgi:hypothetical protein
MGGTSKLARVFSSTKPDHTDPRWVTDSVVADARKAGSRYARGNVPVQDDSFVTPADLEAERTEMRSIKFR